ncbi:hypothetical protein HHI36_023136 [Cryptolaemus montrouzieri]|uniref:Ig-like domain-containing protein n=1 Tax=Cryptolaemus montrouzieri TaxID=559131 RepID=A0ABD2PFF3_9CUCU
MGITEEIFHFAGKIPMRNSSSLTVESIILKAGENSTLTCPGVNEHSLVLALEWFSLSHNVKLVEFMSDSTTVWDNQHRISLNTKTYGLFFHPALAEDSGDYICLVNSRPKPDGIVRLLVQDVPDPPGRPLIVSFTSRSVNLSWAPSQDTHHSHVTHYIIHVRIFLVHLPSVVLASGKWALPYDKELDKSEKNDECTVVEDVIDIEDEMDDEMKETKWKGNKEIDLYGDFENENMFFLKDETFWLKTPFLCRRPRLSPTSVESPRRLITYR